MVRPGLSSSYQGWRNCASSYLTSDKRRGKLRVVHNWKGKEVVVLEAQMVSGVEGLETAREFGIKWIQSATAARLLEVSRQRVYQLCRSGALQSQMYDGRRYVSMRSVILRVREMMGKEDG